MTSWELAARRALWSGGAAAALSGAALALCGKLERNASAAGPLNGPSQWLWGPRAASRREASASHTLVGYAIHHAASFGWALLHEKHVSSRAQDRGLPAYLIGGALTAAFACAVDFGVARGRLQPGFNRQLSRTSLALVYAAFGLGLALGRNPSQLRRGPAKPGRTRIASSSRNAPPAQDARDRPRVGDATRATAAEVVRGR
jgi:hypothetical protein